MTICELDTSWRPPSGVKLGVVANIETRLDDLSSSAGFALAADSDDFSSFHAAHFVSSDDVFVVLLEYDPAPGYILVYMSGSSEQEQRLFAELVGLWSIDTRVIPWTLWSRND